MLVKRTPEWKFVLFPKTAIERRRIDACTIADLMADIVSGEDSSWGGILTRGASGGAWTDWGRLSSGLVLENVGFARMTPDGRVVTDAKKAEQGPGGFFVLPQLTGLAAKGATLGPLGATGGQGLTWEVPNGTFQATPAVTANGTTAIQNTGDTRTVAVARTTDIWPAGKGIAADLSFSSGRVDSSVAEYRLQISADLRISMREGSPIALERRTLTASGLVSTEDWSVWSTLDRAGDFDARDSLYKMRFHILGGRFCWEVNDAKGWLLDSAEAPEGAESGGAPKGIVPRGRFAKLGDMSKLVGGAVIQVAAVGLRGRLELSRIDYDNSGTPRTGTVSRTVALNTRSVRRGQQLTPQAIGHLAPGSTMNAAVTTPDGGITYSVTLKASSSGRFTPMLNQFVLVHEPVWVPGFGSGTDVSAAVQHATVTHAHPPLQAGAEGSFTIDRKVFAQRFPGATELLADNCPVEISTRWTFSDGSISDWKGIFRGYIHGVSGEQRVFNDASLTLTVRDPIVRLRKPAADVDGRCPPLDYFLAERIAKAEKVSQAGAETSFVRVIGQDGQYQVEPLPPSATAYYGADAVKDIIKMFLGPYEAARFNGNGNARRYLSSDHPPYIASTDLEGAWLPIASAFGQNLTAGSLQAQAGAILPPPYGQDALTWINNFAQDEYCIFAYLWNDRDTDDWPQPTYGTRANVLASARLWELSGTDAAKLLVEMASFETRPENDINRVRVTCRPFGQEAPGMPALVQGEARFGGSHLRSAEKTWERTLVLDSALSVTPQRAQAVAAITLAESEGNTQTFPRHTFLGAASCICGDVFVAHNIGLLGNEDAWFRSAQLGHEYTAEGDQGRTWFTTVALEPMSLTERVAFARINHLPYSPYP